MNKAANAILSALKTLKEPVVIREIMQKTRHNLRREQLLMRSLILVGEVKSEGMNKGKKYFLP